MTSIGPAIPAHILNSRENAGNELIDGETSPLNDQKDADKSDRDSDDDTYGPALPPDLISSRTVKPLVNAPSKISGPTIPTFNSYTEDSDDEGVGPMPLPQGSATETKTDAVREFMAKEESRRKQIEEAAKPKALKRDEWMLTPPINSGILANLDTTKLKARTFSRTTAPPVGKVDNSLWTELPAERAQRIVDEVAGVKRRATVPVDTLSPEEEREARKRRKRDEEIRRGVDRHTREQRGGALVDVHAVKTKDKNDEDNDKGIWDHSRDMALSGRLMDDGARKKMLHDAKALGDRFGSGISGGYL